MRNMFYQSVAQATRKNISEFSIPTGVEPMTFRTPVRSDALPLSYRRLVGAKAISGV